MLLYFTKYTSLGAKTIEFPNIVLQLYDISLYDNLLLKSITFKKEISSIHFSSASVIIFKKVKNLIKIFHEINLNTCLTKSWM